MLKPPPFLPNPQEVLTQAAEKISHKLTANQAAISQPKLLQALIQEALTKLNLVSYSDYARLLEIHQHSRAKLDELEAKITALEAQLNLNK